MALLFLTPQQMSYLNTKQLVDANFGRLSPWVKVCSIRPQLLSLAKVLATTNSEPDLPCMSAWAFSAGLFVNMNTSIYMDVLGITTFYK